MIEKRVTTTLDLECEVCGELWEAEAYADFAWYDLVPEFVKPEAAECVRCGAWILPRVGTGIGDALLRRLQWEQGKKS